MGKLKTIFKTSLLHIFKTSLLHYLRYLLTEGPRGYVGVPILIYH